MSKELFEREVTVKKDGEEVKEKHFYVRFPGEKAAGSDRILTVVERKATEEEIKALSSKKK